LKTAEGGLAVDVLVFMPLHERYAEGAKINNFLRKCQCSPLLILILKANDSTLIPSLSEL
jgi:hypothetical protein